MTSATAEDVGIYEGFATLQGLSHDEAKERLADKWWRLNHLYYIIDDKGRRILFKPNFVQKCLWRFMWYFTLVLKARQHGVTTFWCIYFLDSCLFDDNIRAVIIAHTQPDAEEIFKDKIKYPYDNLPPALRREATKETGRQLAFDNNSSIRVTLSPRSGTVQLVLITEFGKVCRKYPDKAREITTGTIPAMHDGILVIESTAEGREGRYFEQCEEARKRAEEGQKQNRRQFKLFFFPWFDHPDYLNFENIPITQETKEYFAELEAKTGRKFPVERMRWYQVESAILGDDMLREHPSTYDEAFHAAIEGAYYGRQMTTIRKRKQICPIPYEPSIPVDTAWDLGHNDDTSIVFRQKVGRENRIIDYLSNNGEGFDYYARLLQERGYVYGKHFLPHDIEVAELSDGKSRLSKLKKLLPGQNIITIERTSDLLNDIEIVRSYLTDCWFEQEKTKGLVDALDCYQKEWDERNGCFKPYPLKNWACHPADAMRTLVMADAQHAGGDGGVGFRPNRTTTRAPQRR